MFHNTEGAITIRKSEKLGTQDTQETDEQNRLTICVGHHNAQANTNNVNTT